MKSLFSSAIGAIGYRTADKWIFGGLVVNEVSHDERFHRQTRFGRTWTGPHSVALRFALVIALNFASVTIVASDESAVRLKSGPEIGSDVGSFYVRAVTGPLSGKSVCYVCRNGDRPVVIVFLRELGPDVTKLLKQLDALVNQHRAEGLRCFVVMLTDKSQIDSPRLQTLSFDEKLGIPLTIASEITTNEVSRQIASDAAITVVLYQSRKVTDRFAYRTGECDQEACKKVIDAAESLATGHLQ